MLEKSCEQAQSQGGHGGSEDLTSPGNAYSVQIFFAHLKENCIIDKQHLHGKPPMPAIMITSLYL